MNNIKAIIIDDEPLGQSRALHRPSQSFAGLLRHAHLARSLRYRSGTSTGPKSAHLRCAMTAPRTSVTTIVRIPQQA